MQSATEMNKQPAEVIKLTFLHYLIITILVMLMMIIIQYGIIYWSFFDFLIYGYILPVILLLFSFIAPSIKYRSSAYRLNPSSIETSKGLFWHVRSVIPMDRVQHVSIHTGPLAKRMNLAKVIIYTSGEAINFPYVRTEEAEEIVRLMTERVKEVTAYV